MHVTLRLQSIAILGVVLALALGAVALGISTAKRYGLIGPVHVPSEYRTLVLSAAQRCPRIPVEVFAAQIAAESGWDATARSPAGAQGIAQFMPTVWDQYGLDANGDGETSVWDAADAIPSAAELNCKNRRLLKEVSGNRLENTLAAYNAGYAAVRRYDGVPPFPETQAYVKNILEDAKDISW
ncbi:MAG: lytic transglycosylase domain-containing protein [Actinomycetota bacterium]|nr:lytic transglycosylase domain-containing protein [Actinomycetota bacterium]